MIVLRYTTFENDEGDLISNVIIPVDLPKEAVYTISPMITDRGTCFKNVTLIEDMYGKQYKIVGNYKDWIKKIRPQTETNKIGFK